MFSESNYTIKEILQQSSSWIRAYKEVVSKKEAITEFFRKSEFFKRQRDHPHWSWFF